MFIGMVQVSNRSTDFLLLLLLLFRFVAVLMITGEGEKDFSRKIYVISHFGLSLYIVGKRSSAVCGSPEFVLRRK